MTRVNIGMVSFWGTKTRPEAIHDLRSRGVLGCHRKTSWILQQIVTTVDSDNTGSNSINRKNSNSMNTIAVMVTIKMIVTVLNSDYREKGIWAEACYRGGCYRGGDECGSGKASREAPLTLGIPGLN